jgi:hypothetical protein
MKYCEHCKVPAKRRADKFCRICGNKVIDMPVEKCKCGNILKSWDSYCRQCGLPVEIKKVEIEAK